MSIFALRLKELRTDKKISQEHLAKYLGMKRENISNYERGSVTNVNSETLDKLANYFNVSVDYLLGRTDNPNPIIKNKKTETYLRAEKDGLDEEEYSDFVEDVEMYMEMRRRMLLEKKKK